MVGIKKEIVMVSIGLAIKEQGRELMATELKLRTVVIVHFAKVPYMVSLWVSEVDIMRHTVTFYSSSLGFRSTNRYDQNGVIYDSSGETIHVYEFLGEV